MAEFQIILLPKRDYYTWVRAASEYAKKYGVNITADPESAGRFMNPNQVVTIADVPGGFGRPIEAWFRDNYPEVRLDVISTSSTDDFKKKLANRISNDDRYGHGSRPFVLRWPTDYPVITQKFGMNPQIYRRFGLPGHEGMDIRAPHSTNIYACADGTVFRVHDGSGNHAYGIHIRIQHRDGYKTIYAHLTRALARVGDQVKTGDRIGLADSTGNSTGSHLHLTLKKQGVTAAGLTNYPSDIIDPTPFLQFPTEETETPGGPQTPPVAFDWPYGKCLVGLHGRADGPNQEADFNTFRTARVEAVKLMSSARPEEVDRLKGINPNIFIMVRLFASFQGRVISSEDFAHWESQSMRPFYERGVRYFEIHNEPNLQIEGWKFSWRDGTQFNAWYLDVMNRLQGRFPEAKFGYPGLSPGGNVSGQRMDSLAFLGQSDEAASKSDWLACHCYWTNENHMNQLDGGMHFEEYRRRFPQKLLFITEFSNPTEHTQLRAKAQQYVEYYRRLRNKSGMGAAFSFVGSASAFFPHEAWRKEDGTLTEIPRVVGSRNY